MRLRHFFLTISLAAGLGSCGLLESEKTTEIKLIHTSDVHGSFYPYDFIKRQDVKGSLSRVESFVERQRDLYKDNVILLDGGDLLQGQPSAYYYNYIDTVSTHLAAQMLGYMGYDAAAVGNHDIETGRSVFERWAADCNFPVLGANIIDDKTGEPLFKPYTILKKGGVTVAVLGMITPAIPVWLSESLWQGLTFLDMQQTAEKWIPILKEQEHADVIIGLFHTGGNAEELGGFRENAAVEIAENVPGFDVVLYGHDHIKVSRKVACVNGDSVLVSNPSNAAHLVSDITINVTKKGGKVIRKEVTGKLQSVDDEPISQGFASNFQDQEKAVKDFVMKKIGRMDATISTRNAWFGPSNFVDLIHDLQLKISGADISITAPLSFDSEIQEGDIYVSDMFNLYKYENMLYTIEMTGQQVKDELESSYGIWVNQMRSRSDLMLNLDVSKDGTADKTGKFKEPTYNFDSAAGIKYTVDVTKPSGERISILSMADGRPFSLESTYKVAVNSYRANGGGEHMTKGTGMTQEEIKAHTIAATQKDLRYYLMEYIEKEGTLSPKTLDSWKFIPENWTEDAIKRERELLYGK